MPNAKISSAAWSARLFTKQAFVLAQSRHTSPPVRRRHRQRSMSSVTPSQRRSSFFPDQSVRDPSIGATSSKKLRPYKSLVSGLFSGLWLFYCEVLPERSGIKHDQLNRNISDIVAVMSCIHYFG
jgi:hypothetical protein